MVKSKRTINYSEFFDHCLYINSHLSEIRTIKNKYAHKKLTISSFNDREEDVLLYLKSFGLSLQEISDYMNISLEELISIINTRPYLKDRINEIDTLVAELVQSALIKRALGFMSTEFEFVYDDEGKEKLKSKKVKYVPPDTQACIFWLKSSMPEKFGELDTTNIKFDTESYNEMINIIERLKYEKSTQCRH